MPKFRKKPVVVDAKRMPTTFSVKTKEGTMMGKIGDWLITGVEGEKYPCDDSIFHKTYEPESWTDEKAVLMYESKLTYGRLLN